MRTHPKYKLILSGCQMLDAGYRMLDAEVRSLLMLEMLIAELLIDRLDTTNEVINNEFLEAGKGVQHPVIGNE